jgi:hypothetical protein
LSYIARLYDKYRFYGLKFMFVNAVSTQTEGNLMMSLDYDTLDAAPANLVQASQLAKYKVSPLYCPCEFSIPVNHPGNSPWLYTFDLSATTNTVDLKTYNLGNFFLSLDGVPQDGKDYGYLAVEYDVELLDKNPVIDTFASKTWDSSAPVAKKARSNVDPADTMEVITTLSTSEDPVTLRLKDQIFVSCDASVGSKVRALVYFQLPTRTQDVVATTGTMLYKSKVYDNDNDINFFVLSVEGIVGSDGLFFAAEGTNAWPAQASDVSPTLLSAMAYTFA